MPLTRLTRPFHPHLIALLILDKKYTLRKFSSFKSYQPHIIHWSLVTNKLLGVISLFRTKGDENCAVLVIVQRIVVITYWRLETCNALPTSTINNSWPLKNGAIGCPETSVWITTTPCVIAHKIPVLSTPLQNTLISLVPLRWQT
jgi:hypothetical protein